MQNQRYKTVIFSALGEKSFTEEQVIRLKKHCDVSFFESIKSMDKETFIKKASGFDIVAVTRRSIKDVDKELIDRLTALKHLIVYSTGYEWIDLDYLNQKNILLSNLPEYCTRSVAEHTVGLILVLATRLHLTMDYARGVISEHVSLRGFELKDKTVGIMGLGRIGHLIAKLLAPFEMHIQYYDIQQRESQFAVYTPFEDLLKTSDYIVVMANKIRNAPPLLTDKELSMVKMNCFIINTARADHVDHIAMIKAIKEKKVYGYAVDDTPEELLVDPTLEPGRVIMTAHTAWYTTEAMKKGTEDWVDCIIAASTGQPRNIIRKWGD